ncbi:MAG: alpha-hydroxy acid oxidase [Rhodospirillales bacterium]|jgi:glycolate oxidase
MSDTPEEEDEFQTLHEIVAAARRRLHPQHWDYLMGATETETTMKRNRRAIDSVAFRPRVLRDVRTVNVTGTVLGRPTRLPLLLAPIGGVEAFDPEGAAACGKASAEFGVPHMLSSACFPGLEETAKAADNARIYQLYVRGDDAAVDEIVKRAIDNNYFAFCMTVDSAHYSRRERDITSRYAKPWRQNVKGREYQMSLSWREVHRFIETHPDYPLVIKGIATAEDAAIAAQMGVAAIYVSNHGGRQLDHGRGALDVLPEIVDAVAGRAKVWVDGGFMRGTDVVKAIASGAECVGLGRLQGLALGAAGVRGLVRALTLLEEEVRIALGLLGVTSFAEVGPTFLHHAEPIDPPHALSAFPLLGVPPGG